MTTRIDWEGGGWAELTPTLTHARRMRIVRVFGKVQRDDPGSMMDFMVVVAAAHVLAWSAGEVDPVTGPSIEELDALPADVVDRITAAANEMWTTRADPNASTGTSVPGRRGSRSRATTPTSSTPSGS